MQASKQEVYVHPNGCTLKRAKNTEFRENRPTTMTTEHFVLCDRRISSFSADRTTQMHKYTLDCVRTT